jgi:ABC-2 type transport system permease protein
VVTLADRLAGSDLVTGSVSLTVAAVMSAIFTVVGTYFAINRLRLFSVAGETS